MKTISCGDLVPGCDFKARAEDEAELMRRTASHLRSAHPEVHLTPALMQSIREKAHEA